MKVCFFFLLLFSCSYAEQSKDSSYWNSQLTKAYIHNSEMQRRWAMAFLAPHLKEMRGNEIVLDVGCGDGKISADLSKFVPEGSVLGIDLSASMILWAQQQYHSLEYPNLMFQVGSFLETHLNEQFDIIVSFCALQHSFDQKIALVNLAQLLKPNGKLLILVPTRSNCAWNEARANTQTKPRWASYWQNVAPRKTLTVEQYTEFLQAAGLSDIVVESIVTMDPFINTQELNEWLCGTFPPQVPGEQMQEFYDEWINEYIHLDKTCLQSDGVIYAKFGYITLMARKPL